MSEYTSLFFDTNISSPFWTLLPKVVNTTVTSFRVNYVYCQAKCSNLNSAHQDSLVSPLVGCCMNTTGVTYFLIVFGTACFSFEAHLGISLYHFAGAVSANGEKRLPVHESESRAIKFFQISYIRKYLKSIARHILAI